MDAVSNGAALPFVDGTMQRMITAGLYTGATVRREVTKSNPENLKKMARREFLSVGSTMLLTGPALWSMVRADGETVGGVKFNPVKYTHDETMKNVALWVGTESEILQAQRKEWWLACQATRT